MFPRVSGLFDVMFYVVLKYGVPPGGNKINLKYL
jgi:hypothetical protein